MASFRPFLPPSNQNPPPSQQRGSQYSQNWGGAGDGSVPYTNQMQGNSNYHGGGYAPSTSQQHHYVPPRNQHAPPPPPPPPPPHQQYSFPPPPPPPPPDSSYPPPPPPQPAPPPQPPGYYYNNHQPMLPLQQPPPPPPPPSSPPPPPSSPPPPPPPQSKESGHERSRGVTKELVGSGRREHGHSNHGAAPKQQRYPVPPVPVKKSNGPAGRVETEEERRLRKRREFEKQRHEEKHRHQLKESQHSAMQKSQALPSASRGHGSIAGSRMGDKRATPFLTGERIENRLKKPTTFLCKLK